jgi:hypothetical protein
MYATIIPSKRCVSVLAVLVLLGAWQGPANAGEGDTGPMRVFRLGNSHTNSIREEFLGLVGASGHRNFVHDQHTVPGAPIRWLYYKAPGDSVKRLSENHWDVVIFQTYNSTNEAEKKAIVEYTRAARKGNPDVRVILYTIWPKRENWDNPSHGRSEAWTEEVAARLAKEFAGIDVAVAPTSLIIRRLGDLADAGQIPGLTGYNDLTQDAGHMGLYGGYAIGACFSAMIFAESPIGYSHRMLRYGRDGFTDEVNLEIPKATARAIQTVVWDVLAGYGKDGLDTGLWINSGRMPPAIVGREYDRKVPVANAARPPTFRLVEGELPKGLDLRDGRIVGTPLKEGAWRLTVQADDGKTTVRRKVHLVVQADRPLRVADRQRKVQADEYIMDELSAQGAIGVTRWTLVDGELPNGLILKDSGLVMGTPAEQGTFPVTVEARDNHPDGPRTARGRVTFRVGSPSEGAITVPVVDETIDVRKPLAKQDLSALAFDHAITDAKGRQVARFALVAYGGDEKWKTKRPGKFRHLLLVVKVDGDSQAGFPMESVHVYLDTNHNREVIYNEDDEHWIIDRKSGRRDLLQGYRPERIVRSASAERDGGWIVAATHATPSGFGVHNRTMPVTYGFNVAVGSTDDPQKRHYWRGDASADKDTSCFGSIVIPGPSESGS